MLVAEKRIAFDPVSPDAVRSHKILRRERPNRRVFFKIGGVVLCVLVLNILIQAVVIQKTYEIRGWEAKIRDVNREMVEVRMDMANLESLDRIKSIAQNDLGMREAGSSDYRCIAVAHPKSSNTIDNPRKSGSLLAKVASWVGGFGATMAKTP
ncbi:hypothetical protein [Hydrogenispora ethanolica]|jgi:cell division protein FtsL|uniref:hypothetical protein n=1 Tax=Hydrogenispora ethanolica TaxID=1082276 RepID=UPI0010468965|nr:hypothetical protein [Hydrogenispora ethanolica]